MEDDAACSVHPLVLQLHKLFNRDLVERYEFLSKATQQIVLEMAEENECWGCRTIAGELKKLVHEASHTTVFT